MAIKLSKIGVSAGVGIADIGVDYADERLEYDEPFKRIKDWVRLALLAFGFGGNYARFMPDETEALTLASLPLVENSAYQAARYYLPAAHKSPEEKAREYALKLKRRGTPKTGGPAIPVRVLQ